MKDSKNEKTVRLNRQHYFHIIINLGSIGPKINLSTMQMTINKTIFYKVTEESK